MKITFQQFLVLLCTLAILTIMHDLRHIAADILKYFTLPIRQIKQIYIKTCNSIVKPHINRCH